MADRVPKLDTNILSLLYNIERDKEKGSSDSEESLINDREHYTQKLWNYFQYATVAISQLYKNCEIYIPQGEGESLWLPFQSASLAVTSLYKEAIESQKKRFELGFRLGQKKRNKELIAWLSHYCHPTRRNNRIRKDDLLLFLNHLDRKSCGLNKKCSSMSPQHIYSSPRGSYFSSSPSPSPNSIYNHRVKYGNDQEIQNEFRSNRKSSISEDLDLQTFVQALNMHGLNGAMSDFTMTSSPAHPMPNPEKEISQQPQISPTLSEPCLLIENQTNPETKKPQLDCTPKSNPSLVKKRILNVQNESIPKRLKFNYK